MLRAGLLVVWTVGALGILVAAIGRSGSAGSLVLAGMWCALGGLLAFGTRPPGAGRESLTILPPYLLHRRSVGPFTLRRRYHLGRLVRPRTVRVSVPPFRIYRVEFDYAGRVRSFGGRLTAAEASGIVALILEAQERPAGGARGAA